ncbi:TatD family hydrolase [Pelagibaculum spongiae]|uniref:Uncharacterized protein n=1 Tax=Pelagibaculum spongiae TaxID=2080658 RepID=A0A2V1H016_9GAMM|nr:TatD family hydrolase [Pelagibaculum spongiae]PVZ68941.1 hypothetical protein DC094_11885 [Pelagibaculum spongiae]
MLVDSHAHLDRLKLNKYDGSLEKALDAAKEQGVDHILCVGIDLKTFPQVLKIAEDYDFVSASVGVHPLQDEDETNQNELAPTVEKLVELAQHPKVVAIGESGLDYYYSQDHKQQMQQWFTTHIHAAVQLDLPLIVHTREAREDTIRLLKEAGKGKLRGVLHCFTESWEMAEQALALGFYISFSGIVTFKNAESLRDVARQVPADRILVETDSPYLAPIPFRGKPCEPAFVRNTAEFLAELRGESFETFAKQTTENYYRLFSKSAK